MRRLTLQGARWHQHGIYTRWINHSSFSIPIRRAFTSNPILHNGNKKQEVEIRYFEQATLKSKDRKERAFEAENLEEQDFLKAKIAKLEEELAELKVGPFGPNSPFMQSLSEEDRHKALEALRKYEEQHPEEQDIEDEVEEDEQSARFNIEADAIIEEDIQSSLREQDELWNPNKGLKEVPTAESEPFEVQLTVPEAQRAAVARFNKTLKILHKNPSFSQRQDVWRSYRRCKESLPFFLDIIPEEGLDMLWKSQIPHSPAEEDRLLHWDKLAEDILASGRDLTITQWLCYLDLLSKGGNSDKAVAFWERLAQNMKHLQSEEVERYLDLGVQIHVAIDKPQRAQDIAMAYLAANTKRDPRILIPIISSWAKMPNQSTTELAWMLYLQVRTMLGSNITMGDYDLISTGFLRAGKIELALAVFKDMMLTGQKSSSESTALFKTTLGIYENLHSSGITASDVNKASLSALTMLPRRFQNKYFYASWMKRLIGLGDIDAAASVVELMYQRGVKPDAKHLNGIIGGWLREGSPAAKGKAETLGWAMIEKRLDWFSPDRQERAARDKFSNEIATPKHMQRAVPPASIETFSILLLYYTRRDRDDMVSQLAQCLDMAGMKPNTFFMNHLLYRDLRKQNILGVWTMYKEMTSSIKPDLQTFACLYDCGKIQYDRTRYHFDAKFPPVRALFKEMITWLQTLSPHQQKTTKEAFSKDLYDQIIRCFCLSLDPQGALVALRSLKELFGFYPDVETIRILIFLLVRLAPAPPNVSKPRRRRIASTPRAKENFENISNLLTAVKDRKAAKLLDDGIRVEDLDQEDQKNFQVDVMCDLLRFVMRRIRGSPEKVEKSIRDAAQEMEISGLDLGVEPDLEPI